MPDILAEYWRMRWDWERPFQIIALLADCIRTQWKMARACVPHPFSGFPGLQLEHEFQKFAPGLPVSTVAATARDRDSEQRRAKAGQKGILITSYDSPRRDIGRV